MADQITWLWKTCAVFTSPWISWTCQKLTLTLLHSHIPCFLKSVWYKRSTSGPGSSRSTRRSCLWRSWWREWRPRVRLASCSSWCAGPRGTRCPPPPTPWSSWWTWSRGGGRGPTMAPSWSSVRTGLEGGWRRIAKRGTEIPLSY